MQQPALAKYRVPVYRALGLRENIDLHVYYSQAGNIPNVAPEGFRATPFRRREMPWPLNDLIWNPLPKKYFKRENCDVLILNWNIRHLSLLPSLIRARLEGVPVLVWGHGYSKHERPLRRWVRWSITRLCHGIIVYSHTVADTLTRAGFDRNRIFVAQNTIDQTEIQAARQWWLDRPDQLAAFRKENNLDRGPHLLFVSRLEPTNRTDTLLHAMAGMEAEFPGIHATIVGDGADESHLKSLARELGLESRVRFTGAIYKDHDLAPWFLSSDLFVYPSNIGLSLQHAFGFGLPVVVGDIIHLHGPEIEGLRPGENGAFFEHHNPDALRQVLVDLLRDPAKLKEMGRSAHRTATQEFTLARMVDGVEAAVRFAATSPLLARIDRDAPDPAFQTF